MITETKNTVCYKGENIEGTFEFFVKKDCKLIYLSDEYGHAKVSVELHDLMRIQEVLKKVIDKKLKKICKT